jgi:hypothetical protein
MPAFPDFPPPSPEAVARSLDCLGAIRAGVAAVYHPTKDTMALMRTARDDLMTGPDCVVPLLSIATTLLEMYAGQIGVHPLDALNAIIAEGHNQQ